MVARTIEEIEERLKAPFYPEELEYRLQSCGETNGKIWGICLTYVTNRAIMNRLDEVVGIDNWWNQFKEGPDGGILCGITIRFPDGREVTKWDGADNTEVEATKGGISGSQKRAAVQLGIGRYLYNLKESFITVSDDGPYRGQTKDKKRFRWAPPELPEWALPKPLRLHNEALNFVSEQLKGLEKDMDIAIVLQEKEVKAKEFIRANGAQVKEDPELALLLAKAVGEALEVPLPFS